MGWIIGPARFARDLSIGIKLALTVAGALALLAGVSWFAFDRLGFVTRMQANVDRLSITEQQVERSLLAAQELRVISREIEMQQTANGIRTALERAADQTALATKSMHEVAAGQDQPLLDAAVSRLDGLLSVVKSAATLRAELLTFRQKRLFQVRPVFENAMRTLMTEFANGSAVLGGVDSVRDTAAAGASADQHDPTIEAANRYRLAVTRVQGAALMFMATGNGSAVNEVAGGTAEAAASMAVVLSSPVSDAIKADARVLEAIGNGISGASADVITMSRKLDQVAGADVGAASEAMRSAFDKLADAIAAKQRDASSTAQAAGIKASNDILTMVGAMTLLMVVLGSVVIRTLGGPIRRLTTIVQMIAGGKTDQAVPYTTWKDEIGRMAASVETLRGVMRQTFVQTQMIEQLPVGVMTTEPSGDFRITYVNAEARAILETVQSFLAVPVDELVGQPVDVFHPDSRRQRALVADPAKLPHRTRITLGQETLDLRISAVYDRDGGYAGPLLTWRRATAQARLVHQFEESVGTIARVVASAADGMREAASEMRQSAISAGERTLAVSAASNQASNSVSTAAAGAEELAVSVAEIGRQVAESAEIAGLAVAAAEATDASVSGLNQAAERISAVVQLISDIAARTNLLALNATIEAARAGEAGKGFAVVAGEVKNLATQTGKATQEIGGQINAMQQATGQAVDALRSIGRTIQRMNEIALIISGSVERQGTATQSIANAVQQAAAGTVEVNSNIAAVSQVVEETGTRAEGVLAAATGMTGQAAALKDEVAKFLVAVQQAA